MQVNKISVANGLVVVSRAVWFSVLAMCTTRQLFAYEVANRVSQVVLGRARYLGALAKHKDASSFGSSNCQVSPPFAPRLL